MMNRLFTSLGGSYAQGRNVYNVCDDVYVDDTILDLQKLVDLPYHMLRMGQRLSNSTYSSAYLDRTAPDYADLFIKKGNPMAADEILNSQRPLALEIPIKQRSEFGRVPLPDSDLLRAIHYMAKHLDVPRLTFDETALLALGLLAESWADELISKCEVLMFAQQPAFTLYDERPSNRKVRFTLTVCKPPPPKLESDPEDSSDIVSVSLLESDSSSDEETKHKRRKVRLALQDAVQLAVDTLLLDKTPAVAPELPFLSSLSSLSPSPESSDSSDSSDKSDSPDVSDSDDDHSDYDDLDEVAEALGPDA